MPWFDDQISNRDPLAAQELRVRRGDRLPAFAAVLRDLNTGDPIDLSDARCYLELRALSPGTFTPELLERVELTIESAVDGLVSYSWLFDETLSATPGVFDASVYVQYSSGARLTVPSDEQSATVNFRSSNAAGWFAVDSAGDFVEDGLGGYLVDDEYGRILLNTGGNLKLSNDSWLLTYREFVDD